MKKQILFNVAIVALLVGTGSIDVAQAADPVVAIVDGQKYTYSQVMAEKNELPKKLQSTPDDKLFPLLQNKVVDSYLVKKASAASNVAQKPEVKEAIDKAKEQIIEQAYLFDKIKDLITPEKIKAKFDELIKNFPKEEEVHLRLIMLKDKATAVAVIKALKNGVDFKKLAREKSADATAKDGGDLGFFRKSELPKEMAEVAFNLKTGTYSQEPIQMQQGWGVLFVEEKREAKPPTFDEVKDELKSLMAEEALVNLLKELRKTAKVQLFEKDGSPKKEENKTSTNKAEPAAPTSTTAVKPNHPEEAKKAQ